MRDSELFIDTSDVGSAETYGELRTHGKGHPDFWEELKAAGRVPRDEEYDEVPRGRVTYDTRKQVFYVFLDRCIRRLPDVVDRVIEGFSLQSASHEILGDAHYRCPGCMRSSSTDNDE